MRRASYDKSGLVSESGKLILIVTLVCAFSCISYSQSPGKDETLLYINRMSGPVYQVEVKGGNLIIDFKDKTGKLQRRDKIPAAALDTIINYEKESGLLYINCADNEECVTRELILQKIKRQYNRMSIPVNSEEDYLKLHKAFDHLISILAEINYKNEIVLE